MTPAAILAALLLHTPHVTHGHVASDVATHAEGGRSCTVYLAPMFDDASDALLAAVIGHELAHCSLRHSLTLSYVSPLFVRDMTWQSEYEADALGIKIARYAGFDSLEPFVDLLLAHRGGALHPTGPMRVKALVTGEITF